MSTTVSSPYTFSSPLSSAEFRFLGKFAWFYDEIDAFALPLSSTEMDEKAKRRDTSNPLLQERGLHKKEHGQL